MKDISRIPVRELVSKGEAELKTGPFGTQLKASDYTESGIPVINVRNIGFGSIRPDKLEYISAATRDLLSSHVLRQGDIVFGRKGAVERHIFVRQEQDGWFQGSDCLRLRLNAGRVNPLFASYFFLTPEHQRWMMNQCSHGATMASLNQEILERIELPLPPLPTQCRIAGILSAYDDLIENSQRRIKILEKMARRLYREWFVHFRFPGHETCSFVESPLGEIPEGWEVRNVKDLATVTYGFPFASKRFNTAGNGVPVIRIRDILNGCSSTFTEEDADSKHHVKDGHILVGMDGDFHMCIWSSGHAFQNQRVARFEPAEGVSNHYLFLSLEKPIHDFNKAIVGTTVAHLGDMHIKNIQILLPSPELNQRAREILEPISDQVIALKQQIQNLRRTRDLLLPRLLSGQIDVEVLPEPALQEVS